MKVLVNCGDFAGNGRWRSSLLKSIASGVELGTAVKVLADCGVLLETAVVL